MTLLVVISAFTSTFDLLSGQVGELGTQINQHQVIIRTARYDFVTALYECGSHRLRIFLHLRLILLVRGIERFAEATALAAITCCQRLPWMPGKTAEFNIADIFLISPFGVLTPHGFSKSLPIRITPPARAAQGFVGGPSNDMSVFHRIVKQPGGNQARRMRHVDHRQRAHFVGDLWRIRL